MNKSGDQPIWEDEAVRLHSLVQELSPQPDCAIIGQLTKSLNVLLAAIEQLDEEAERASEYTKYRKLIPNALTCAAIRPDLMVAERHVDDASEAQLRFVPRAVLYPSERILVIKKSLQIDIHIKQPRRSTCEGLIRAFQAGDLDVESFLAWFREHAMGLLGTKLDPYIVEVLLGMHVSGGEVRLPGEMRNVTGLGENEIIEVIVARAKARKRRDENGTRDLVRVLGPGQQKTDPTCDAMNMVIYPMWTDSNGEAQAYVEAACKTPDVAYLSEIDELFASPEASQRTLAAAIIRAANRELLERVGRKAGLNREESRFLHRRALGKVTKRDDESLWRAVNAKMPAIRKALEDFRYGQIR